MIKQLHPKSIPTINRRNLKATTKIRGKRLLQQIAKDLLSPRTEAIEALLAKATLNR